MVMYQSSLQYIRAVYVHSDVLMQFTVRGDVLVQFMCIVIYYCSLRTLRYVSAVYNT